MDDSNITSLPENDLHLSSQEDMEFPGDLNISENDETMPNPSQSIDSWAPADPEPWLSQYKYFPSPLPPVNIFGMEVTLTPEEKQAKQEFSILQARIANLPQELQDKILLEFIKIHLQPGRVILTGCRCFSWHLSRHDHRSTLCNARHGYDHGWEYRNLTYEAFKALYPRPDLSIFYSFNQRWTKIALDVLYLGNTWIMGVTCLCCKTYIHETCIHDPNRTLVAPELDPGVKVSCIEFEMGCKSAAHQIRSFDHRSEGVLRLWLTGRYTMEAMADMHGLLQDCGLENWINIYDEWADGEELDTPDHIWRLEESVRIPWEVGHEALTSRDWAIWCFVRENSSQGRSLFKQKRNRTSADLSALFADLSTRFRLGA